MNRPPEVPLNYVYTQGAWCHPTRVGRVLPTKPQPDPLPTPVLECFSPINHALYLSEVSNVACRGMHLGEPMAKQRPRFSPRGHAYTPQSTKQHQAALADCVRSQIKEADSVHLFGIRAVFYVQTYQRKDVDNLLKALLDALNGLAFKDDAQIKEVMGWSVVDLQNPRTEFVLYRIALINRESGQCVRCGKAFRLFKSWKQRLFCSRKCQALSQQQAVEVMCASCGKVLVRKPSAVGTVNYCSWKCKSVATRTSLICAACGISFTKPRSLVKRGQQFCSKTCYHQFRVGKPSPMSQEQLSQRSKKAWITRKSKPEDNPEQS